MSAYKEMGEDMEFGSVHKFGGTSLADAKRFAHAISLLPKEPVIVVVSAISGVTNQLESVLTKALQGELDFQALNGILDQHIAIADSLLPGSEKDTLCVQWQQWIEQLRAVLTSTSLVRIASEAERTQVLGLGECLSASLLSQITSQSKSSDWLDARKVLHTRTQGGICVVNWERTSDAFKKITQSCDVLVVTGFLATDEHGHQCLLERNGSDFSAAVFAELCGAQSLTIWSDRDGIYSADPRYVENAFPLPELSYHEALELAYFGAAIIHPKTIDPCRQSARPIFIKNSFRPDQPGSCISDKACNGDLPVRGISSLNGISVITIEGAGMIGVSGVAARTFYSLEQAAVSVIMISQASSEHSICLCVRAKDARAATQALADSFANELSSRELSKIRCDNDMAIVAAVGDGMVGHLGIAGKMCRTLSQSGINIRAIAQGASERNISIVVAQADATKAIRALHSGFYLSAKTIAIAVIGVGVIGSELLDQIFSAKNRLSEQEGIALIPAVIANSKRMCQPCSDSNESWLEQVGASKESFSMQKTLDVLANSEFPFSVVIDCTASDEVTKHYPDIIQAGCHLITANKRAGSGDLGFYHDLKKTLKASHRSFLYEATVCAGLPVIHTLQDLLRTGDRVNSIEGIVSGSLSYIFSALRDGKSFSEAVFEAKEKGYTEPDPRDDLSGMDVMRKVVCLARELAFDLSLEDVQCETLVPAELKDCSLDEFMQKLPQYDEQFGSRMAQQTGEDKGPWAYIGFIDAKGEASVSMRRCALDHPFAQLSGTDNMIVFRTVRYSSQPLVIQGPGAGAAVTAGGVFADLLRLISSMEQPV